MNNRLELLVIIVLVVLTEAFLPRADYVETVSGEKTDKSTVFVDNFICSIMDTYADENVLTEKGKVDYGELRPVLFEMPTYTFLRTGERIGKCKTIGGAEQ